MAAKGTRKKTASKKAAKTVAKQAKTAAKKATDSNLVFLNALPKNDFFKMEMDLMKPNKQFEKLTQDATALGQDQLDALIKSTAIFQKGLEEIVKVTTQIAQEAGESNASATKALFACKTLNELADAQTKLAQTSFDTFMSNATKLSELSVKVCTDSLAPINDQMGKSIKKASETMAAA